MRGVSNKHCLLTLFSLKVFILWWPWKLGQGHQNIINFFNYPNATIHKKMTFRLLVWPWKWGQGHQNLITSFPRPNNVSMPVWSNSAHLFRRKSADKKEAMQTPTGSAPKALCPHSPPFFCCFLGARGHNLALIDPVVSEMFEKCGRQHRRACLYDNT